MTSWFGIEPSVKLHSECGACLRFPLSLCPCPHSPLSRKKEGKKEGRKKGRKGVILIKGCPKLV